MSVSVTWKDNGWDEDDKLKTQGERNEKINEIWWNRNNMIIYFWIKHLKSFETFILTSGPPALDFAKVTFNSFIRPSIRSVLCMLWQMPVVSGGPLSVFPQGPRGVSVGPWHHDSLMYLLAWWYIRICCCLNRPQTWKTSQCYNQILLIPISRYDINCI